MSNADAQLIQRESDKANETIHRVERVIALLDNSNDPMLVMDTRHRTELTQFLKPYRSNLQSLLMDSSLQADVKFWSQIVSTRSMELELAIRFVERCFLTPRRSHEEAQILETADWLCVEGFQVFVSDEQAPLPIVAIESSVTPAVWAPNSELPIPSIFQVVAVRSSVRVPTLPIICLPGHWMRSVELFPLLSHEVGHCVDNSLGISATLLAKLPEDLATKPYWNAWMREIVADAIGLTLSGTAFRIALERFLDTVPPVVTISTSYPYPPDTLRFAFLDHFIQTQLERKMPPHNVSDAQCRDLVSQLGNLGGKLFQDFLSSIAPEIDRAILKRNSNWVKEEAAVARFAKKLKATTDKVTDKTPFRFLPSIFTHAHFSRVTPHNLDGLVWLQNQKEQVDRPAWVQSKPVWEFRNDLLPTLRPTHLGTDGKFKVPPQTLMATHDAIAFVGATNWQLLSNLQRAFAVRNREWTELHIFFASRDLLKMVEYGPFDAKKHRDESKDALCEWLSTVNPAARWCIYEFDGPPVFASFWDWSERGGRIHVSPALLQTRIGECPATDHLWLEDRPSDHYEKYVQHLNRLFIVARKLAISPGRSN